MANEKRLIDANDVYHLSIETDLQEFMLRILTKYREWMPWKWYMGVGCIIPQQCRNVQIASDTRHGTSLSIVRIAEQLWRINTMKDKEKLIQLFKELTVFATPEKAAAHFMENHVTIRKYGHWQQTGMHLLPYRCSACESLEEGRTNFCPSCGAEMKEGNEDG